MKARAEDKARQLQPLRRASEERGRFTPQPFLTLNARPATLAIKPAAQACSAHQILEQHVHYDNLGPHDI